MIAYLAPIMYALGIWIFFNAVVLGDPFAWVIARRAARPRSTRSPAAAPDFSLLDAIGNALRIQLIFPVDPGRDPAAPVSATRATAIGGGFALLILLSILYSVVSAPRSRARST